MVIKSSLIFAQRWFRAYEIGVSDCSDIRSQMAKCFSGSVSVNGLFTRFTRVMWFSLCPLRCFEDFLITSAATFPVPKL